MNSIENKRRLSPRVIVILVLALVVLAEGAFLLLHRSPGGTDAGAAAASAAPAEQEQDAQPSVSAAPEETASETSSAPDGKSDSSAQSPAQTPVGTNKPESPVKPYAGVITLLENYVKSPTEDSIAHLLGGELLGDQMQRFLPALLTMSGQDTGLMKAELDASFGLPAGTAALTVAGDRALSNAELNDAREQVRTLEQSFASIADGFSEYSAFTDADWNAVGSQLGLSGADAKRLIAEIGDSAAAMAQLLSGADVTGGYAVTLKTNSGETAATNVYCVAGKWVTSAFFNMEFD